MRDRDTLKKTEFADKLVKLYSDFEGTGIYQEIPKAQKYKFLGYSNLYGNIILNGTDEEVMNIEVQYLPANVNDFFFFKGDYPEGLLEEYKLGSKYKFIHVKKDFGELNIGSHDSNLNGARNLEEYFDVPSLAPSPLSPSISEPSRFSVGAIGICIALIAEIAIVIIIICLCY